MDNELLQLIVDKYDLKFGYSPERESLIITMAKDGFIVQSYCSLAQATPPDKGLQQTCHYLQYRLDEIIRGAQL